MSAQANTIEAEVTVIRVGSFPLTVTVTTMM